MKVAVPGLPFALAVLGAVLLAPVRPSAHEIPSDVTVQAFLQTETGRVRLLVRVPIAATVNEVEWPSRGLLLDMTQLERPLRDAGEWVAARVDLYEEDRRLARPRLAAARVALPSDTSFDGYDRALAWVTGPPLPAGVELVTSQALVDVLLEYPSASSSTRFSIDARFGSAGLQSNTVLRFRPSVGAERAFRLHGDAGLVRLDPRWFQAASRFVVDGFFHILGGIDHLLFLLCLVVPFRRLGALAIIVTSFTIAHSITLVASAYDLAPAALWFPPLVETLIAGSILYMALENIVSPALRRRWVVAFGFGLVHGFGFSFALRETLQMAGDHVLTSLLAFNVGVELGQLLVLLLVVPALGALFRYVVAERMGTVLLSAMVAHTGWHWMTERGSRLWQYPFTWPAFDVFFLVALLRWTLVAVILAAAAWLIFGVYGGRVRAHRDGATHPHGSVS